MKEIHPKERYSKSATRTQVSEGDLLPIAEQFGFCSSSLSIKLLSGGFKNANFKIEDGQRVAVLRVSATDTDTTKKEGALLNLVRIKGVKAPNCLDIKIIDKKTYAIHEYIGGITLENFLITRGKEMASETLFFEIGTQLAKVHTINFDQDGFLGPELEVAQPLVNADQFILGFMKRVLAEVAEDRLAPELRKRFLSLIDDKWHLVEDSSICRRLTHLDFNPKNIMVSESGEFQAILDWEFGMSSNCIADFGNFFRFPYDYPSWAKDAFAQGYRDQSPDLPEKWEDASRLIDLGAVCGFLERKEDYPKTFATARAIAESTLEHFSY